VRNSGSFYDVVLEYICCKFFVTGERWRGKECEVSCRDVIEILAQILRGGSEENKENFSWDIRSSRLDWNCKCKSGLSLLQQPDG